MSSPAPTYDSPPGSLDMLILRLLSFRDLHAYGIAQFIQRSSGHELLLEEGSLYPALQRLELNGWIDGDWGMTAKNRRARIYQITSAGLRQVAVDSRTLVDSTCRPTLAARSAAIAIACTSLAASGQPAPVTTFQPERDCDPVPALIRHAAKDARIPLHLVCYVSNRPAFALKAGEAFAANLDRSGDLVQVVLPFGQLLLVNGTEPAVQMAVRFYDTASRKRLNAARFAREQDLGVNMVVLDSTAQGTRALRKSYAAFFTPYQPFVSSTRPRSKPKGRQ
ncbi:PadR family transcriptional regulator [Paludibaculum fermentans]|uniref:PadR family transcriptional regulator n=1 Tax=Paludibaculum fermentans TaxID=1473598 RepID=UPI003EB8FA25